MGYGSGWLGQHRRSNRQPRNIRKTVNRSHQTLKQLTVHPTFRSFVERQLLPAIDIAPGTFWAGVQHIVETLAPLNRALLDKREQLQASIDAYHRDATDAADARDGGPEPVAYRRFLEDIGYLKARGPGFRVSTKNVDPEIAGIPGPQLVVPVDKARFALNAANARWGSLYDALYGSDVIDDADGKRQTGDYNPARGAAVIEYAADFLDRALPLSGAAHSEVARYELNTNGTVAELDMLLTDGRRVGLADARQFVAHAGSGSATTLLFRNHGLHIEICIDPASPIGSTARANVADVVLESAVTTIQDCEDSVAAVDADDKTAVYRNWFGLMQGTLEASFKKGGKALSRQLNEDRRYTAVDGTELVLPGRSLMLVRNVGHLMTTDALLDTNGEEVFEGILDAIVTVGCALNDIRGQNELRNSRSGSVYIVKPKMHGPDEAAFCNTLMAAVEDFYGLERNTIKIGVMDEERRTTVNLMECIREVRERLVFINTGFLDRTGDEIHTSMHLGPMLPKEAIKLEPWIRAYEDWNVDVGIQCGLPGKGQIGKGMFPKTDAMREMLDTKHAHPEAGANCAWVPSPTAASLHAMHYHEIDVKARQQQLAGRQAASLDDILTPPLGYAEALAPEKVQAELDNNAQSILGYVVRWIDQGIGCSKVPDIDGVNLMEDRATLRISSQHIANWLLHGVCDETQVKRTLLRMAAIVDEQNADDPAYRRMTDDPENNLAFQAASALIFDGARQPSGYTEPLLHAYRRQRKRQLAAN